MFRRIAFLTLFVFALVIAPVFAHEGREVGEYILEFGWNNEPTYAGLLNAVDVFIEHHEGEELPADFEADLRAEVMFGGESIELLLEQVDAGYYSAPIILTMAGDYTVRIFGTMGDLEVDETFNTADGEVSTVEPAADIMFPPVAASSEIAELRAKISELEARLERLEANSQ